MRFKSSFVSVTLSLLLLVGVGTAFAERQAIFDWIRLRGYQAPSPVAALATDTTMNSYTRRLFYVYHPEIDNGTTFNKHCPVSGEKTIVLGCYIKNQGIYLFNVTDSRLNGVEEVTAAHETLHAAYDRLNPKEKTRVDNMINEAYKNVTDERIRSTIDAYRSAGADVTNELHSILGTEVSILTPDLEAYYSRYFNDRKKIVNYSEQYEKAFTDRKTLADSYLQQINGIEKQLDVLKNEIDGLEASLTSQQQALQQERHNTNDPASFNAKVEAYNSQVDVYKSKVTTYNLLVKQHNDLLNQYNEVALEENQLIRALDSRSSNIQTQ